VEKKRARAKDRVDFLPDQRKERIRRAAQKKKPKPCTVTTTKKKQNCENVVPKKTAGLDASPGDNTIHVGTHGTPKSFGGRLACIKKRV